LAARRVGCGIVVVPHPKKDLGLGLVKSIRLKAGI
jgi:predicted RNA binding protein YcfA (HicA-like mRNA interferase family)